MYTTAIITLREFLEAFLIIGVFLGISRKLKLKRELEIFLASTIGIGLSLVLAVGVYSLGDKARTIFSHENAEILEGYLQIFSGIFIAYVVMSLHGLLKKGSSGKLIQAHQKLVNNKFDLSLFLTIIFMVLREGFEIALFTASTSLFATFIQNLIGLAIGFVSAGIVATMTFFAFMKFSIGKIYKFTEYAIVVLGASLVQRGITELFEVYFNIRLSDIFSLPTHFLPSEESLLGHLLKAFVGIDNELSIPRIMIMAMYITILYLYFRRRAKLS